MHAGVAGVLAQFASDVHDEDEPTQPGFPHAAVALVVVPLGQPHPVDVCDAGIG